MTASWDFTAAMLLREVALLIGVFVVTAAHFIMEPLRWIRCYRPSDHDAESSAHIRDALLCTAFATYLLPFKLGIPLRAYLLQRAGRLQLQFISLVVLLDGAISLAMWIVAAALCVWLAALHWRPPAYIWWLTLIPACALAAIVIGQRAGRLRWLQKLPSAVAALDRPVRRVAQAALLLAIDIFLYGVRHALIFILITQSTAHLLLVASIGIVSTFAGIASGLPMGLLGYDATLIALLSLAGVDTDVSVLVAVVNRGVNLVTATALGLPASMRLGLGSTVGAIIGKLRDLGK